MFFARTHSNETGNPLHEPMRHIFTPQTTPSALSYDAPAPLEGGMRNVSTELPVAAEKPMRSEYEHPATFEQNLSQAITRALEQQSQGALFIISINNLAMIMSAYGHVGAEKVMQQLCELLHEKTPSGCSIERIGRDQIGIIALPCEREDIAMLARSLHGMIQDYGTSSIIGALHVTASIGSVDFPGSAANAVNAIDKAYIAQHSTYNAFHRSYDETRDEAALCRQQMGLANYLRRSIQENRLRLAYQPVIRSATGKTEHYEALLRIIGEDGKISSAGALIPIAERMGLIDMIDHLVFDLVVKELLASPTVKLAFNVSSLSTDNPHWLNHAVTTLKKYPAIAPRITVEITETAAQHDLRRTAYFVASLQAQGCKVALDDFGSGYTSFRQLKALSVDTVKIDGVFIKDLVENPDNRFFVKTLLDFARGFGLEAVAEFVEKGETAKLLMELGVDYMQGYYFGKPENHRSWLDNGEYHHE